MNNLSKSTAERKKEYDLCLKEFKVGFFATAIFIFLSSLISYFLGYKGDITQVKLIGGYPHWIFWGVLIPWVGIVIFTIVYGLFIMKGDDN